MIHQKRSRLHHASGTTAGAKAATLTTEDTGPPRPDARGCSSRSARAKNRSQVDHTPGSPRTRALRAVAENDLSHSAVSEIQANTALPVQGTPLRTMGPSAF